MGAGTLLAVEGKKPRIKGLQSDTAGRAYTGEAEHFFIALTVQDKEAAAAFLQGVCDQRAEFFGGQISDEQFDGVLVITA